jgi:hypothetical protein
VSFPSENFFSAALRPIFEIFGYIASPGSVLRNSKTESRNSISGWRSDLPEDGVYVDWSKPGLSLENSFSEGFSPISEFFWPIRRTTPNLCILNIVPYPGLFFFQTWFKTVCTTLSYSFSIFIQSIRSFRTFVEHKFAELSNKFNIISKEYWANEKYLTLILEFVCFNVFNVIHMYNMNNLFICFFNWSVKMDLLSCFPYLVCENGLNLAFSKFGLWKWT